MVGSTHVRLYIGHDGMVLHGLHRQGCEPAFSIREIDIKVSAQGEANTHSSSATARRSARFVPASATVRWRCCAWTA